MGELENERDSGERENSLSCSSCTAREGQAAHNVDIILRTVTNMAELITGGDTTSCRTSHTLMYAHTHIHFNTSHNSRVTKERIFRDLAKSKMYYKQLP